MTQAIPGAPIGPDIEPSTREHRFDHVPALRELLTNGGWPGVVYAQVCVEHLKAAADRRERPAGLRPIRGATYYTIVGPRGEAAMALVGCGLPIPGSAPEAGERLFFTDGAVERRTGHAVAYPIWLVAEAEEPAPPAAPASDPLLAAPGKKRRYVQKARKRVRGRFVKVAAQEASDGAQPEEPQPAQWGEGSEGDARVQDRDLA